MTSEVLLGFMTAAWLFTVGGVSYSIYRYVYKPWTIVRKDIAALNQSLTDVRSEMQLRKALYVGDEDYARIESKAAVRRLMRAGLTAEG